MSGFGGLMMMVCYKSILDNCNNYYVGHILSGFTLYLWKLRAMDLTGPPWSCLLVPCSLTWKWTCHTSFDMGFSPCYRSSAIGSPDPTPCQHDSCSTSKTFSLKWVSLQSSHLDYTGYVHWTESAGILAAVAVWQDRSGTSFLEASTVHF